MPHPIYKLSLSTLVQISRPRFWIYILGPVLVALAAAKSAPTLAVYTLIAYATLPANLLIYGVNDIFDQETDRLNTKKGTYEVLLEQKQVRQLSIWIVAINVPLLAALALELPAPSLPWLGLFLLTGIGYSMPPLRAKTKPFLDALSNVLYAALGFTAYVALSGHQPSIALIIASTVWCMAMHAYSAVPDISADSASGTSTIATVMGAKPTLVFCAALYALSGILSYQYLHLFSVVAAAVYLALMAVSFRAISTNNLFLWYSRFPLVNSLLGMGLFFAIAIPHYL